MLLGLHEGLFLEQSVNLSIQHSQILDLYYLAHSRGTEVVVDRVRLYPGEVEIMLGREVQLNTLPSFLTPILLHLEESSLNFHKVLPLWSMSLQNLLNFRRVQVCDRESSVL